MGIALRSVECAGSPANAGGTAEASSFVPDFREERLFYFGHEIAAARSGPRNDR